MEKEQLLSVVVPVYNTQDELPQCIESILEQTYGNLELILVDDGSTDKSGEICDEYAREHANVRVLHQKNAGHDRAVAEGRKMAQGFYLGYVDCDDWLEPHMYQTMIHALEQEQADVAVCAYSWVYPDGRKVPSWPEGDMTVYSRKEAVDCAIEDKVIQNYSWNKVYKMSLWEEIGLHGLLVDDFCSTVETFMKSEKIVCINKPLYNYRQREGSLLHLKDAVKTIQYCYKLFLTYEWRFHYLSEIYPEFCRKMLRQMLEQGISVYHYMISEQYTGSEKQDIFDRLFQYAPRLSGKGNLKIHIRIALIKMGTTYEKLYRCLKGIGRRDG